MPEQENFDKAVINDRDLKKVPEGLLIRLESMKEAAGA